MNILSCIAFIITAHALGWLGGYLYNNRTTIGMPIKMNPTLWEIRNGTELSAQYCSEANLGDIQHARNLGLVIRVNGYYVWNHQRERDMMEFELIKRIRP